MKFTNLPWLITMVVFATLASTLSFAEQPGHITVFDAPGANDADLSGTFALSVNQAGAIAGYFVDSHLVSHGFVRDTKGKITTFDAPGAGTDVLEGTHPVSINDAGTVTGYYTDRFLGFGHYRTHGFVRTAGGQITTFDVPGASLWGSFAIGINASGWIAGHWMDGAGVQHAFLRHSDGTFSVWSAPLAGLGQQQGTFPTALLTGNTYTGYYLDKNNVGHAFLRGNNGSFFTFDVKGAGTGNGQGTFPTAISEISSAITGHYIDSTGLNHGFLNSDQGSNGRKITTFDAPGAPKGTFPTAIVPGALTGYYSDTVFTHGFLRVNGIITTFDAPNLETVNLGTYPQSMNSAGIIVGYFIDGYGGAHGFVRAK